MSDFMLSIVKGVSRNRNISELGIDFVVSTYVNRNSELHCSCPLVGCNLWLLASMYNHSLLHVASLYIWSLRVISSSVKLSNKLHFLLHHFLQLSTWYDIVLPVCGSLAVCMFVIQRSYVV